MSLYTACCALTAALYLLFAAHDVSCIADLWDKRSELDSTHVCFAVAGVLLDKTDSWSVIFGAVAAVYALGFAGFAALGSGELQNYDD